MIEVTVLIPVRDNAGVIFDAETHLQFEGFVVERCGGFTQYPLHSVGAWQFAGLLYRDDARIYIIAFKSITETAHIGAVAAMAKAIYRQKAIYIRYLGLSEEL